MSVSLCLTIATTQHRYVGQPTASGRRERRTALGPGQTHTPTTIAPTTIAPTASLAPASHAPTTRAPTASVAPVSFAPTSISPTLTLAPMSFAPTTVAPTGSQSPVSYAPTTVSPTKFAPTLTLPGLFPTVAPTLNQLITSAPTIAPQDETRIAVSLTTDQTVASMTEAERLSFQFNALLRVVDRLNGVNAGNGVTITTNDATRTTLADPTARRSNVVRSSSLSLCSSSCVSVLLCC